MNSHFPYDTLRIAPTHESGKNAESSLLSFEEIRKIAKAAVDLGVDRFDIAGGDNNDPDAIFSVDVMEVVDYDGDGVALPCGGPCRHTAGGAAAYDDDVHSLSFAPSTD